MKIRPLVVAIALTSAPHTHAQSHECDQAGTLKIDARTPRAATLHVGCSPNRDGGALVVELIVTEANTRQDFDYNDFEGPDAPAGDKALSRLAWATATASTEITHAATGSYLPVPPESFMFGIDQLSHRHEPPAKLLAAVNAEAGRFVWTQTGYDNPKRQLVATFDLDATAAQRLHDAVASCLPKPR